MISLPRIARFADAQDFDRLLDEITRNGRPISLPVRLRLSEPAGIASAALGLALQRCIELTYRPMPISTGLASRLLDEMREDGSFGTVAGTAIAVAGLLAFRDQAWANARLRRAAGGQDDCTLERMETMLHQIDLGIAAAWHWLRQRQEQSAALRFDGPSGLIGDELDSAIVLWQLGLEPRFARAVRFADLLDAVEDAGLVHERRTAPLLARLTQSGSHRDGAAAPAHDRSPER